MFIYLDRLITIHAKYGAFMEVLMTLYLLRYNNYYNRRAKRLQTLQEYRQFELQAIQGVNFNPNDGVSTQVLLNINQTPDYIVCSEDNQTIDSRWFVLEDTRTRGGQYKLILYRDTIADYWGDITNPNASIFVQKGMLRADDSFIFNNEQGNFNQLKQSALRLWGPSNTGWLVGYIPRDAFSDDDISKRTITIPAVAEQPNRPFDYQLSVFNALYPGVDGHIVFQDPSQLFIEYAFKQGDGSLLPNYYAQVSLTEDNRLVLKTLDWAFFGNTQQLGFYMQSYNFPSNWGVAAKGAAFSEASLGLLAGNTNIRNALSILKNSGRLGIYNKGFYDSITGEAGKIIYDPQTGAYYRIQVQQVDGLVPNGDWMANLGRLDPTDYAALQQALSALQQVFGVRRDTKIVSQGNTIDIISYPLVQFNENTMKLFTGKRGYRVTKTLISAGSSISITIPKPNQRKHCQDQPFDILCLPYYKFLSQQEVPQWDRVGQTKTRLNAASAMKIMQQIAVSLGNDQIYDIQLLPYGPVGLQRFKNVTINQKITYVIDSGPDYGDTKIVQDQNTVGWIYWAQKSSDYLRLNFKQPWNTIKNPVELKVKNSTQKARLCSNNYSSFFDFSIVKNRGLSKFEVACTWRPFNPWFKISPTWNQNGLYAKPSVKYDATGLLLGGDYSIAQVTSAWANYQLTNKNYLNIFDRQIQNIQFNQDIDRFGQQFSTAIGAISAAASGFKEAGAAGALGKGILSTAGGAIDWNISQMRRNQVLDYTKDQFQYQLGNIKALPQGLAKTAAQTEIDTIVPTIQIYDATDEEIMALTLKILYNGMTVNRIGGLAQYIGNGIKDQNGKYFNYFKGQLIRLPEEFNGQTHVANTIAVELNKGVFLE